MLYLTEGDYINAGLSALSIIPGADAFTKTGKASKVLGNGIVESGLKHLDNVADGIKKLVKKADDAIDLEKHLPKKLLTEEAGAFAKKADKVADDVVEDAAKAIKSGTPSGFYQDANGRWHRPNGDFALNAEVGIASPAKIATGSHGNSLSDPRTNYGYVLVDKDTNEILKFGETLYPETRYSKSYLEQNNAVMKVLESGSKEYIHNWQHDLNMYFKSRYGDFPSLNKGGW